MLQETKDVTGITRDWAQKSRAEEGPECRCCPSSGRQAAAVCTSWFNLEGEEEMG